MTSTSAAPARPRTKNLTPAPAAPPTGWRVAPTTVVAGNGPHAAFSLVLTHSDPQHGYDSARVAIAAVDAAVARVRTDHEATGGPELAAASARLKAARAEAVETDRDVARLVAEWEAAARTGDGPRTADAEAQLAVAKQKRSALSVRVEFLTTAAEDAGRKAAAGLRAALVGELSAIQAANAAQVEEAKRKIAELTSQLLDVIQTATFGSSRAADVRQEVERARPRATPAPAPEPTPPPAVVPPVLHLSAELPGDVLLELEPIARQLADLAARPGGDAELEAEIAAKLRASESRRGFVVQAAQDVPPPSPAVRYNRLKNRLDYLIGGERNATRAAGKRYCWG